MSNIIEGVVMEEIYIKYSKPIYRYLYSLTQNHELSEELMQETFCSAIKGIKNFRGDCRIYSWLCEIAKNKWKDYIQKNGKVQIVQFDDNIEKWLIKDDFEERILTQSEEMELYKEIHKLDKITKEVVNLRINGELPFKEIGLILNKSEVWARTTFYRAKSKLKESLKNEDRM